MTNFTELVKRNIRVYIRDKGAVFFSLLSMLIVLGLMLFFLGDMNISSLTDLLGEFPDRNADTDKQNAELFVMLWTCGGILSINAATVTLAVYSSMISDRKKGVLNSIYTAPVSRLTISAAYVTSAWICSVIICTLTLAISEIYCIIQGGAVFTLVSHLKLMGMIMANSFTYASLMYLAAVLVKTEGAWSGMGTVIGTLVGFIGGIYLPIGSLAEEIGTGLKFFPVIYGAKMFRSVMTKDICNEMFTDVPEAFRTEYLDAMGVNIDFFGAEISDGGCVAMLLVCGLVFLVAGAFVTGIKSKRDR